ncbi:hypothetical protein [Streptomyces sp. LN245]|uniref:hypothetical protein n=1 Tax=Streptomyces sp. LN245 TaxID=3112975 RepID=UPI0037164748
MSAAMPPLSAGHEGAADPALGRAVRPGPRVHRGSDHGTRGTRVGGPVLRPWGEKREDEAVGLGRQRLAGVE